MVVTGGTSLVKHALIYTNDPTRDAEDISYTEKFLTYGPAAASAGFYYMQYPRAEVGNQITNSVYTIQKYAGMMTIFTFIHAFLSLIISPISNDLSHMESYIADLFTGENEVNFANTNEEILTENNF